MRRVGPFALILALVACASGAGRGAPGKPQFQALLEQRFAILAADSQFRRAFATTDGRAPLDQLPPYLIGRLSDTDLVGFYDLFQRSLKRATPSVCSAVVSDASGAGLLRLATEMDSRMGAEWVGYFEKLVWAYVRNAPVGSLATQAEVQAFFEEFRRKGPKITPAMNAPPSLALCRATRDLIGWMVKMPTARSAPLLRTAMLAGAPAQR